MLRDKCPKCGLRHLEDSPCYIRRRENLVNSSTLLRLKKGEIKEDVKSGMIEGSIDEVDEMDFVIFESKILIRGNTKKEVEDLIDKAISNMQRRRQEDVVK